MINKIKSIDDRLAELLSQVRSKDKTEQRLDELLIERGKLNKKIRKMERAMQERIQEAYPTSEAPMKLIHAFLQTIEEGQLEFHKEEYFRIAMIHNELIRSRELVDFEVGVLENKQAKMDVVKTSIHELLQHRADVFQIKEHQDLAVIVERIDNQSKLLVEMIEAIDSAVVVQKLLNQAEKIWDKERYAIQKMDLKQVELFKMNLSRLSIFQNQIIETHRRYIILQCELNDILSHLSFIGWEHHRYSRSFISDFEDMIMDDIKSTRTPKSTLNFIHTHKTHVRQILTTLRSDRDKTRRLVARLKRKREKIIQT